MQSTVHWVNETLDLSHDGQCASVQNPNGNIASFTQRKLDEN